MFTERYILKKKNIRYSLLKNNDLGSIKCILRSFNARELERNKEKMFFYYLRILKREMVDLKTHTHTNWPEFNSSSLKTIIFYFSYLHILDIIILKVTFSQ